MALSVDKIKTCAPVQKLGGWIKKISCVFMSMILISEIY